MDKFFNTKYRLELSENARFADIFSSKGKLVACFTIRLKEGNAVLFDKVNDSMSIIPTEKRVVSVMPFEYNDMTDILSVSLVLEDEETMVFKSTVSDLMSLRNFYEKDHCHHPHPPIVKPSENPMLDRYVTLKELNEETNLRKHADEEIWEALGNSKSLGKKVAILEDMVNRNHREDKEQGKKIQEASDMVERIKFQHVKSISDIRGDIQTEVENRTKGQNRLYDAYIGLQKQADKNSNKIIEIKDSVTCERNRAVDAERELHEAIHKVSDKFHGITHQFKDAIDEEESERRKSDKELEHKIHAEHAFAQEIKEEYVKDIESERQAYMQKYKELEHLFNHFKGRTDEKIAALTKVIDNLKEQITELKNKE